MAKQKKYDFELGLDRMPTDGELDGLFDVGCDDMSFGTTGPSAYATVHRRAPSFIEAAVTAINDIESVDGPRVIGIKADPELTIEEIARKANRTREAVRLRTKEPTFPAPVITTPRHRFWRWSEVAPRFGADDPLLAEAAPVARALNAWLTLRAELPAVAPELDRVRAALEVAA